MFIINQCFRSICIVCAILSNTWKKNCVSPTDQWTSTIFDKLLKNGWHIIWQKSPIFCENLSAQSGMSVCCCTKIRQICQNLSKFDKFGQNLCKMSNFDKKFAENFWRTTISDKFCAKMSDKKIRRKLCAK